MARSATFASKGRAALVALGLSLAATALHAVAWPSFGQAEGLSLVAVSTVELIAVVTGFAAIGLSIASLIGRERAHGKSGDRASKGAAVAAIVIACAPAALLALDLATTPLPGY